MINHTLRASLLLTMLTMVSQGQQLAHWRLGDGPLDNESVGARNPNDSTSLGFDLPDLGGELPGDISFATGKHPRSLSGSTLPWVDSFSVVRAQNDESEPSLVPCQQFNRYCGRDGCRPRFRLSEFNIYPTFSYSGALSATYNEFEFASHTDIGYFEMENRTVLNVADLPSGIQLGPTNPGDPAETGGRGSGFGDILSGFFFSRKETGHRSHLGIGPVFTFPSATDDLLGSQKYTVGPGVHFSTESERLTAGFFLWQSWSFAGDPSKKEVNQLFGKPFLIYEMTEKWHLVYVPLGMSCSWHTSGDKWTVPIGGGIRRLFKIGHQKMGLQFQAFDYVARKEKDPEWELRATIEFLFDE
jgi:hypothetical protein